MDIAAPVEEIKGIGPKTAELLRRAGIFTLRDLAYYLPRTYENFQQAHQISELRPGQVVVKAKVENARLSRKSRGLTIVEATLRDASGAIRAVWFNQAYRVKQLSADKEFIFTGKLEFSYGRYQIMNPAVHLAEDILQQVDNELQAIYPAKGNLKSANFHKFLAASKSYLAQLPDLIPNYPGRATAMLDVHFPSDANEAKKGREYLATEELFCLLLASRLNRQQNEKLRTTPIKADITMLKKALARLPFRLTNAQRRALWEILQDMASETPMNRLLQGDVGSGKTMVAALSALVAAWGGVQTALMAPTEVLAAQHAASLANSFSQDLRIALLTGSTKHKAVLKKRIAQGEVDLVIGTHALITDDTYFNNLGLAIIDEQHRFGVAQRQKLLSKARTMPHLLSMTATPIPRSLQLTIFGDLAVSVLDELPAGRKAISTKVVPQKSQEQMWRDVEEQLSQERQVYYVCKKIDNTNSSELSSVKKEYERIVKKYRQYKVGLLHGRMKSAEKEAVMKSFSDGRIDILVCTTVVEVGVNVPNATSMIIADADQYGLSQLHQLRGRVGRGDAASYCYLVNSKDAPSRRLREIENSQDGFYLAEVDLKLRGPGEIYGSLQHGALDLRIASVTDTKLVHRADQLVRQFLQQGYNVLEYKELSAIVRKYQRLTTLN